MMTPYNQEDVPPNAHWDGYALSQQLSSISACRSYTKPVHAKLQDPTHLTTKNVLRTAILIIHRVNGKEKDTELLLSTTLRHDLEVGFRACVSSFVMGCWRFIRGVMGNGMGLFLYIRARKGCVRQPRSSS